MMSCILVKMVFGAHDLPHSSHRVSKVLPKARPVIWRSADHPMPGTIYRLPDDMSLQRGITYTFLPDGRSLRVPAMNRLDVRAAAQTAISCKPCSKYSLENAARQLLMIKVALAAQPTNALRDKEHHNAARSLAAICTARECAGWL